jgi:hypothetical protein
MTVKADRADRGGYEGAIHTRSIHKYITWKCSSGGNRRSEKVHEDVAKKCRIYVTGPGFTFEGLETRQWKRREGEREEKFTEV